MDILIAKEVVKDYSHHRVLDKVSINVPSNSIFGLLGPNGAGKTTLMRIINGITAPDEGELIFEGRKMSRNDVYGIGYLPEERGLYKKMKVGEQALYLSQLKGVPKNEAMKRLKYWFEKFGITDWWNKKVEELSKGMQQKVQFITTILHEPRLLIFDEPFSGFDPINADLLKNEILDLKKKGSTIIFSTHNMSSVEELCDRISLINKSKVILEGNINDVKRNYRTNTFELTFSGNAETFRNGLSQEYQVISLEQDHDVHKARVKSFVDQSGNKLVSEVIRLAELKSFNELIPSMNDIFIKIVRDSNYNVSP